MLYVCCFFFFFKQKTAYEMRISDWSSDVCSSDLSGSSSTAYGAGSEASGTSSTAIGGYAQIFNGNTGEIENVPTLASGQESTEIGRASCRERVCQYV